MDCKQEEWDEMSYEIDGIVSIWVANVKSESLLEDLLDCRYTEDEDLVPSDFAQLCETGSYDEDFREAGFLAEGVTRLA